MAKKGQAVQLQAEIATDAEWEKLLERTGLIVVDVYSDWCGPCQGMSANLKKLKLEVGGDMLQLAMAKNDTITALARFRNKSEPTWMFISKGKMVNLMFGADAPKLTRLIIEELKNEQLVTSGEKKRDFVLEVDQRSPEEQERYEAVEMVKQMALAKEEAKRAKEFHDRKVAECTNILTNLPGFGTILVFPCAKDLYHEVLNDLINEAGLTIQQTEKITVTEDQFHELLYFSEKEEEFGSDSINDLLQGGVARALLIKNRHNVDDFENVLLEVVYGELKDQPGTPESPYQLLFQHIVEEETEETKSIMGIWTPSNDNMRATCLKLFFSKYAKAYELEEPEPIPPYYAVVFDSQSVPEVIPLMHQYKHEVMHYGFFTSEVPVDAKLVAKSLRRLEDPANASKRTYKEKLVIQLAKRKSEAMLNFVQKNPIYISPNTDDGFQDCEIFFPDHYADSLQEEDMDFEQAIEEAGPEEAEHEEFIEGESAEGGKVLEEKEEEEGEEEDVEEEEDEQDDDDDDIFGFGIPGASPESPTTEGEAEPTEAAPPEAAN